MFHLSYSKCAIKTPFLDCIKIATALVFSLDQIRSRIACEMLIGRSEFGIPNRSRHLACQALHTCFAMFLRQRGASICLSVSNIVQFLKYT